MIERLPFTDRDHAPEAIRRCAAVLDRNGVLLVPTETFYGLATRPNDATAVDRIMAMKGRPPDMALPVLVADWQQLESLVRVPLPFRSRLSRLWPGPLTVVLPVVSPIAAAPKGTLAVRIPDHSMLRAVLYRVGPVTGTSANRHHLPPATDPDASLSSLLSEPDLILDGGVTGGGRPTTLVDLTGETAIVLRQGALQWLDAFPETSGTPRVC